MQNETKKEKPSNLPEIIYTPHSQLRKPATLIRSMLADLKKSKELAWRLFIRNLSAQYRQTMFGYAWAFLPPLATAGTFIFLNQQKVFNFGTTDVPYPVYVMLGSLLWQTFVDAINSPILMVTQSKIMLAKINFPREALILAGLEEIIFNFFIRFILFIAVFVYFKVPLTINIIFVPFGIIAIAFLGLLLGLLLTPLAILYEDIQRGLGMILSLWFFLTPVAYPVPTAGIPAALAKINPISPLLITTRDWLLGEEVLYLNEFIFVFSATFLFLLWAWVIYRISMPHLIARIPT